MGPPRIPAYYETYDEPLGWEGFSGLLAFDVDTDAGISELGRVDHKDLVEDSVCLYREDWGEAYEACGQDYWWAQVRRSVYIEDNLFSISDYGVKVNELEHPEVELARVLFYPL